MKIVPRRKHSAFAALCLASCLASASHAQTTTAKVDQTPAGEAIPVVPLPDPNGYDFFVRAGAALKTENPGPPSAAASQNVATDLALQRAYVAKNAETLRLLRQGLRLPSRKPAQRTQDSIDADFKPYQQFRDMARLLVQESRVRLADGDLNGAVDSLLDGIQFGTDIVRGGPFMAMLVGVAVEAVARADMWSLVKHLDAPNARRIEKRLEAIEAARVPLSSVIEEEKWFGLSLLRESMRAPEWAALRAGKTDDQAEKKSSEEEAKAEAEFKNTSDAQIEANYIAYMDAVVALTRKPFDIAAPAPPAPADAWSRAYTGKIIARPDSRVIYERSVAANRLLIVALALRVYHGEHNAFPTTLNALAPQPLAQMPTDPFSSTGAPLRYQLAQGAYTLYSIGPDGVDDDGRAIPGGRIINAGSKGDIVAGANT